MYVPQHAFVLSYSLVWLVPCPLNTPALGKQLLHSLMACTLHKAWLLPLGVNGKQLPHLTDGLPPSLPSLLALLLPSSLSLSHTHTHTLTHTLTHTYTHALTHTIQTVFHPLTLFNYIHDTLTMHTKLAQKVYHTPACCCQWVTVLYSQPCLANFFTLFSTLQIPLHGPVLHFA